MSIDAAIARVCRDQHGLITVQQVHDLGGDRRHLLRRAATGRLEQLNHHVFRVAGMRSSWEARVLASVLAAGPGAVASHLTAAALWSIDGFSRTGRPELSVRRGHHYRPSDARCHESSDLDRCQVVLRDQIPTTDLPRTLLDLGRHLGVARLGRAVEAARRSHDLEWEPIIRALHAHARQGRHGIRRLRTVIARDIDRDEITDSDFELLVLTLLAERGVETPELHYEVRDDGRFVAEVDLAWPRALLAVELDGQVHREREVWERDHVKLVELQSLGWTVLPFTWRMFVTDPDWLVRSIQRALRA